MATINKVQEQARAFIKKDDISAAVEFVEKSLVSNKVRDVSLSDSLVSVSQRNRELSTLEISGSISFAEYRVEKASITKSLLALVNELPTAFQVAKTVGRKQSNLPLIYDIEKTQDSNLSELRGEMLGLDSIIVHLIEEIQAKQKKINKFEHAGEKVSNLEKEIDGLRKSINEEKIRYSVLKEKYNELKIEKQKIYELDFKVESLRAKLEGKERELEVLRESFILSRQMMDSQRKIIDDLESKINLMK